VSSSSLTIYLPAPLKVRITDAAEKDHRTISNYLSLLLDKTVPTLELSAGETLDLEQAIALAVQKDDDAAATQTTKRARAIVSKARRRK
jgi:hypothetical protein